MNEIKAPLIKLSRGYVSHKVDVVISGLCKNCTTPPTDVVICVKSTNLRKGGDMVICGESYGW